MILAQTHVVHTLSILQHQMRGQARVTLDTYQVLCSSSTGSHWWHVRMCMSALNSLSMNLSWTRVGANPHPDVGWSEFNLGWPKYGFHVSDCMIVQCVLYDCAVCSEEMTGRQQWSYFLVFGAQPMCRASLRSFEDFTQVSSSPCVYSPCIFNNLLVVSDRSSARWLATAVAAAAMPLPRVTAT